MAFTFTNTAWGLDSDPADAWEQRSACRPGTGADLDWFFTEGTSDNALFCIEQAKATCASCSVSDECLIRSIERRDMFGIFGGLTPEERKPLVGEAVRREMTHCRSGRHLWTEANTAWSSQGHRSCRACTTERVQRFQAQAVTR